MVRRNTSVLAIIDGIIKRKDPYCSLVVHRVLFFLLVFSCHLNVNRGLKN